MEQKHETPQLKLLYCMYTSLDSSMLYIKRKTNNKQGDNWEKLFSIFWVIKKTGNGLPAHKTFIN